MKRRTKVFLGTIACLFIVCGFVLMIMPVRFLQEIDPERIVTIKVFNGNNGDEFEITDPDDILYVVNALKQLTFKKEEVAFEVPYWYRLTFINENGEETESLGIQNSRFLRKDITQKVTIFYRCNGELDVVGDFLESLEAVQFPDYRDDPDYARHW